MNAAITSRGPGGRLMTVDRLLVVLVLGALVGLFARGGRELTLARIDRAGLGALGGVVGALAGASFGSLALLFALVGASAALLLLSALSSQRDRLVRVYARGEPRE
jgi:hypothetical protein